MWVNWRERLQFQWNRRKNWLGRKHSQGWRGLSILIFKEDAADQPASLRINYFVIGFGLLMVLALPVAGGVLFMQESLKAADASRVMESRRALMTTVRMLTVEKARLVEEAAQHIGEFQRLSSRNDPGQVLVRLKGGALNSASDTPLADRPNNDLERLGALNRRTFAVLEQEAYHSLRLTWTRMNIYGATPRGRPLPTGVGFLTSVFGSRPNPFGGTDAAPSETHSGVDFASAPGTPIIATAAGVVIRAMENTNQGYGKHVRLHHGLGYTSLYAHCRELAVNEGDYVSRGQVIGYLGRTGRATGNHVHYEVQFGADVATDPMEYIQLK
ncbi:MAG: M23 family metallopeptidase [bacterium]|nr:M23 family metallopeptidase [bacterium]